MKLRLLQWVAGATLLAAVGIAAADPILKPRKYHGPIPQSSFTLRFGFMGGAENDEMITFLDGEVDDPFEFFNDEFGTALSVEGTFMHKFHPQFGVRATASGTFFRSTLNWDLVDQNIPPIPPDSLPPVLDLSMGVDVDLFILELSAIYFTRDAAVSEFQIYTGGGFSVGLPHAKMTQTRVVRGGSVFDDEESDEWSVEAGVHAVLGAMYYASNTWAFSAEGRYQIMESRFPLDVLDPATNQFETAKFIIDYTGFFISFGVTRAF